MRYLLKLLSVSGLLGVVAYMSQVGPDDAVSNISKWVSKLTPPPEWVKAPEIDTIWTVVFVVFALLVLTSYLWPTRKPAKAIASPGIAPVSQAEPLAITDWLHHPNYYVWVASCLWINEKPTPKIDQHHPAYPTLQMIKGYLENGTIRSVDGGKTATARVAREELIKIAKLHDERPKFLFPTIKQPKAKSKKPEPNMRLEDVVKRITGKTRLPLPMNSDSMDVLHACDAIREKALLGLITVFGGINWRTTPPADYDRMIRDAIPAEFWKKHKIDVIGFLNPQDDYRGFTCDMTGYRAPEDYYGIWFDRNQIGTQWPS